jgi:hypothetical protein
LSLNRERQKKIRKYLLKNSKNLKIKPYEAIALTVLYGYEAWCLTLREEHTLMVFENRVLRRIFGPEREEVTGGWRKTA